MKKFLTTILLLLIGCCVFALEGKWVFPKNITIYIPPNHRNSTMMQHAFDRWTRASNQKILFKNVYKPNLAQIKVEFVEKIDTMNRNELDKAIGLTRTQTLHHTKLVRATIYIADKTQDGKILNRDEIFTTMIHEVGHAIGLNHTDNPKSVMYPGVNVIQEIEQSDVKTLYTLYGWQ